MSLRFCLGCVFLFLPVHAANAQNLLVFGASSATNTAGLHFSTELDVANRDNSTATVTFTFIAPDAATQVDPVQRVVAPGQTLVLSNALVDLWGLDERTGIIAVNADRSVITAATKYAPLAGGRTGSVLPLLDSVGLLGPGQIGDISWLAQSSSFDSAIGVYLGAPDTTASLVLFDASGAQVAQTTLRGGPFFTSVPLSSLLTADTPIARAELRVSQGTAGAFAEVTDLTSGTSMSVPMSLPTDTGKLLVSELGLRRQLANGKQIVTDVRISNLSVQPAAVTLFFADATAKITIPPRGVTEVKDALGSLFAQAGDAAGALTFSAATAIAAVVRTAAVAPDGSGSALSSISLAAPAGGGLDAGTAATFLGGASPRNDLLIASRSATNGAAAALTLVDAAGASLGSANESIAGFGSRLDTAQDLFGMDALTSGSALDLGAVSGTVTAAALAVDRDSGAPFPLTYTMAQPSGCSPPAFSAADVAPSASLSRPGSVTVSWQADLADSVDLIPGPTGLPPAGSTQMNVAAGTIFTLRATNGCGQVSTPLPVSVGAPVAGAITNFSAPASGSAGQPGQTVSLHLANISPSSTISDILLTAANGDAMAASFIGISDAGDAYFRIPLWPDNTAAGGYRTGAFRASAIVDGNEIQGGSVTIQPLAYTGDPVAGFQALLDSLSSALKNGGSTLATVPGLASAAAAQKTAADAEETALRTIVSQIRTTGAAVMASLFTDTTDQARITKDDLATLLAYNQNLLDSATLQGGSLNNLKPLVRETRENDATIDLKCLAIQRPAVPACKALAAEKRLEAMADDYLNLFDFNGLDKLAPPDVVKAVKKQLSSSKFGRLAGRLNQWLNYWNIACLVLPVNLDTADKAFRIGQPKRVAYNPPGLPGHAGSTVPSPVNLWARLVAFASTDDLAQKLEDREIKSFIKTINKGKTPPAAQEKALEDLLRPIVQSSNGDFDKTLVQLARSVPGAKPVDEVQVGKCDIDNFYPLKNGPSNRYIRGTSILELATSRPQGDLSYWYLGRRVGKTETMCIEPVLANFVLPGNLESIRGSIYKKPSCSYKTGVPVTSSVRSAAPAPLPPELNIGYADTVSVGAGETQFEAVDSFLEAYDLHNLNPPVFTRTSADKLIDSEQGETYQNSRSDHGFVGVGAFQTGKSKWSAFVTVNKDQNSENEADLNVVAITPPVRDGSQSIHLKISSTGTPCPRYQWIVTSVDELGNQTLTKAMNQPQLDLNSPGAVTLFVYLDVQAHGLSTCSQTLTAEVDVPDTSAGLTATTPPR